MKRISQPGNLLGHGGNIDYRISDAKQLTIEMPDLRADQRPCDHAFSLKLTGFELELHEAAASDASDTLK